MFCGVAWSWKGVGLTVVVHGGGGPYSLAPEMSAARGSATAGIWRKGRFTTTHQDLFALPIATCNTGPRGGTLIGTKRNSTTALTLTPSARALHLSLDKPRVRPAPAPAPRPQPASPRPASAGRMNSNGTATGFRSSRSAGRFFCSRAKAPIGPSACQPWLRPLQAFPHASRKSMANSACDAEGRTSVR